MQNKKTTLYVFIFAQCSVMALFILILVLSLFRLHDVRQLLGDVTTNSVPALSQAAVITRDVQQLVSLTARLTSVENQSARRIIKTQLDEVLARLEAPALQQDHSDKYFSTQLNVLAQEIEELNTLVRQQIEVEKEVKVEREALFDYLNQVFEGRDERYIELESSQVLVSLILKIAQINQQFQLHELRLLEGKIAHQLEQLRVSADKGQYSDELVVTLEKAILGEWGMVDKQANVMRIRGRSRGRGSFVEHLAEEVASSIELQASAVTKNTAQSTLSASKRVTDQITLSLGLSTLVMLICCAIIFYIYKRIILRLIALTNMVEHASDEVAEFEGNDEISRLAKSFALYFNRVKTQETELIRLSLSDALTNIANRRAFELEIEKSMAMAKRHQWPLTIMLIDVDFFKAYNDHYGHTQGDLCLKAVASCLNDTITRNTDFCARFGGEEFVAILPNTDEKGAQVKAQAVREAVEHLQIKHEKSVVASHVTVSLGVATFYSNVDNDLDEKAIIDVADKVLYNAKISGRNRCVFTVVR